MNDQELIKQLLAQGFTEKDIAILRQYVDKEGSTYRSLLNELRKRLIVMTSFTLLMSFLWAILAIFQYKGIFSFSIAMLFFLVIVYFMTPVKLATKAFIFLKRNG